MKLIKYKRYLIAAVTLVVAVAFMLSLDIETPAEHDRRVANEQNDDIIILEDNTNNISPGITISEEKILTPTEEAKADEVIPDDSKNNDLPSPSPLVTSQATNLSPSPEVTMAPGAVVTVAPDDGGEDSYVPEKEISNTPTPVGSGNMAITPTPTKQDIYITPANTATSTPTNTPTPTNTNTPTPTKKAESEKYINISFSIVCDKVVGNSDLKTESDIPENGVIFEGTILVKEGTSVLDVLDKVCKAKSIPYVNKASAYGAYISSINNLSEGECGRYSGWKYKVNDVSPNVGCSAYFVSENDEVVWYFATGIYD